jgi:hypothetical protein
VSDTGAISVPTTPTAVQDIDSGKVVGSSPESTGWNCATRSTTVHIDDGYLALGSTSITVTADPGTTWTAVVHYARSMTLPWAVNAHGQTYGGVDKEYGAPDLQGARATNGRDGYIVTKQFDAFRGCGYLPVYESDGTTVIGRFSIGISPDGTSQCDSADSGGPQ